MFLKKSELYQRLTVHDSERVISSTSDKTWINLFLEQKFILHQNKAKVCSIKFRSKHSVVLVLCLQRNLMEQTLISIVISDNTQWPK